MQPDSKAMVPPQSSENDTIRDELKRQVGPRNYQHWFGEKTTLDVSGDELIVGVGSPFLLAWMQKQFRAQIGQAAHSVLGPSARVRFEVDARVALASEGEGKPGRKQGTIA